MAFGGGDRVKRGDRSKTCIRRKEESKDILVSSWVTGSARGGTEKVEMKTLTMDLDMNNQ